jgi:hypothetical protein
VPEPELEHFFKVVLAFDTVSAALPPASNTLKVAVVRQLIERYYEGHPPDQKRQALEALGNYPERTDLRGIDLQRAMGLPASGCRVDDLIP